MPETVTYRGDMNIIQVDSFDVVSEADLKHTLETVMKLREEHGTTRVFIDASKQSSMPSPVSLFQFGNDMAAHVRDMRFAVYFLPGMVRDLAFLEDVAVNRGVQVKRFEAADAALQWLLES